MTNASVQKTKSLEAFSATEGTLGKLRKMCRVSDSKYANGRRLKTTQQSGPRRLILSMFGRPVGRGPQAANGSVQNDPRTVFIYSGSAAPGPFGAPGVCLGCLGRRGLGLQKEYVKKVPEITPGSVFFGQHFLVRGSQFAPYLLEKYPHPGQGPVWTEVIATESTRRILTPFCEGRRVRHKLLKFAEVRDETLVFHNSTV